MVVLQLYLVRLVRNVLCAVVLLKCSTIRNPTISISCFNLIALTLCWMLLV